MIEGETVTLLVRAKLSDALRVEVVSNGRGDCPDAVRTL